MYDKARVRVDKVKYLDIILIGTLISTVFQLAPEQREFVEVWLQVVYLYQIVNGFINALRFGGVYIDALLEAVMDVLWRIGLRFALIQAVNTWGVLGLLKIGSLGSFICVLLTAVYIGRGFWQRKKFYASKVRATYLSRVAFYERQIFLYPLKRAQFFWTKRLPVKALTHSPFLVKTYAQLSPENRTFLQQCFDEDVYRDIDANGFFSSINGLLNCWLTPVALKAYLQLAEKYAETYSCPEDPLSYPCYDALEAYVCEKKIPPWSIERLQMFGLPYKWFWKPFITDEIF